MDKNDEIMIGQYDYLEDTDGWCDLKKMYFYGLALAIAKRVFELQPALESLSYFSKFAYDVVVDFLDDAHGEELQNDLITAKASLNRLLAETEEAASNCERLRNGALVITAVMHEAILTSTNYIEGANLDILRRDLSSMKLNTKEQTCFSPFIETYATIIENVAIDNLNAVEDDLDKEAEQYLLEDLLAPCHDPKLDKIVGIERKPSRELTFTIPAVAYFYESNDHKHYYKNKIRKMYDAVECTDMTEDNYEAINWCIANWNWYAAKLFSEGKFDVARSIVYALLTESVKGFSRGKLWQRLSTDLDYDRTIGMRILDTRNLFSHFLRHSDERYLNRIYNTFNKLEEDPSLPAFLQFEMSSVSRAAARVLDIDY